MPRWNNPNCGFQKGNKINLGRKYSESTLEKKRQRMLKNPIRYWLGKTTHPNQKASARLRCGPKSNLWRGGKSSKNKKIRGSVEYMLWRKSVFERDDYTCVWCGKRGVTIHADHIKPFAFFPELRFAIDNGRTLCIECHRTTSTYGNREVTQT